MRIIEKCWIDLHAGYQSVVALEGRLKSDWKRALQVAQKRTRLTNQSRLKRRRNVAGLAFFLLLFICASLWIARLYYPENWLQLWFYICALTLPGLIAGLFFVVYVVRSFAQTPAEPHPSLNLMERWWSALEPGDYAREKHGDEGEIDFLHSLSFLDNRYIAVWGLLTSAKITSDTDVLLLGPNGIWVFEVKYWNGTIHKKNGVWSKVYEERRASIPRSTVYEKSPDEQWLHQKEEISKTIRLRLSSKARLADIIQGGIVFAHPNAKFGEIAGQRAAYGTPRQWHKKVRQTAPVQGFSLDDRLQVLDALITYANLHEKQEVDVLSAAEAARQLYNEASAALREYVTSRVRG